MVEAVSGVSGRQPRVTVLMPVYNGERYLREAIGSILGQTFGDFELLIVNDGSTDASESIIRSHDDPRIRLVTNEANLRLTATLNRGLALARGQYLARMDCDDISLPERLGKQVAFLDAHPEVAVVGTWYRTTGEGRERIVRYPKKRGMLRSLLLFASPLAHPTVMLRRELFVRNGFLYDPDFPNVEDYELWSRISVSHDIAVMGEVLLRYRVHQGQVTWMHNEAVLAATARVQLALLRGMGLAPSERQVLIHRALSTASPEPGITLEEIDAWLCTLLRANAGSKKFPMRELTAVLVDRLLTLMKKGGKMGEWGPSLPEMKFFREGEGAYFALTRFLATNLCRRAGLTAL